VYLIRILQVEPKWEMKVALARGLHYLSASGFDVPGVVDASRL
jgi:hypothetical protein